MFLLVSDRVSVGRETTRHTFYRLGLALDLLELGLELHQQRLENGPRSIPEGAELAGEAAGSEHQK